jgi:PAS domain S-box-containing protein
MKLPPHQSEGKGLPNEVNGFKKIDAHGDVFKQIFNLSVIPILVHDIEMNILNANEMAVRQFGYSLDELQSKKVFDLHTTEELDHSAEVLDKMEQTETLRVKTAFRRADGSVFPAEATPCKYLLYGKPVIHVFIQDITERVEAETKLNQMNRALEAEVEKVKMYSKELETRNEELEEFAHFASHDLKAPVINLKTLSQLINSHHIAEGQDRELFGKLKSSIDQLHRRTNALNKMVDFKTILINKETQKLQFDEVLAQVEKSLISQIDEAQAVIKSDFSEVPEIDYPALQLKSVVQNLLTNALKYKSPERPLSIELYTRIEDGHIVFSIQDNGLGFDTDVSKDNAYGQVSRFHDHIEGSGLGLYMVKSVARAHGGRVEIKSKPGEGSLFKVYLTKVS